LYQHSANRVDASDSTTFFSDEPAANWQIWLHEHAQKPRKTPRFSIPQHCQDAPIKQAHIDRWGATLGFGMPASMEYLTEGTAVENRGRVSAIVFFATFGGIFISAMILELLDYQTQFGTLGALRFVGLIVFILLNPAERSAVKKAPSYKTIIRNRSFFLYFSAWVMFALVNYLSIPILNSHFGESFANASATTEVIFTAVFALVGGVLCCRSKSGGYFWFHNAGLGLCCVGHFSVVIYWLVLLHRSGWHCLGYARSSVLHDIMGRSGP
jgi:uncharacterized membrane protein (DUF485 family)